MQLIYYRGRQPNFGDDLNLALWPALAPTLFDGDGVDGFIGIGTVIGMAVPSLRTLHVFGSGAGNNRLDRWQHQAARIWCVRGPLSARLLELAEGLAITDGAILTPLVDGFPKAASAEGRTVIVPHWESFDHPGWEEVAARTEFELVDPRAAPHAVVARIARARLVLAESMHGAIIADTYGIPWIAFATSKNFGRTKWVDWAMSVGLEFRLTLVPPPSAGPVLAFGRGGRPYGHTFDVGAAEALREFEERMAHGPHPQLGIKTLAKRAVRQFGWTQSMLKLSPARTAAALVRLAAGTPSLSAGKLRLELRDRLLDRLACLSAEHRAGA